MFREKLLFFFMGSVFAFGVISLKARAASSDGFGDDGYVRAEEIAPNDQKGSETSDEPFSENPDYTKISTIKNTFGVLTEENAPIRLYGAPVFGFSSVIGNDSADGEPRYALGAMVGVLLSSNLRIEGSYVFNEQDFSNPRTNTTSGVLLQSGGPVFNLKQSTLSAGTKLFILGRESRIRPYLGGGLNWARGTLNYTSEYLTALGGQSQFGTDFTLNQFGGFGELGAELAITRAWVASLGFKWSGVISSSTSNSGSSNSIIDPSKSDVGNSLSRSASYLVSAGVGIYF